MQSLNRTNRESRRGTMLVVVLGILVALFVIGTAFSFITLSERRAAQNYLDRQRALDLALDGVEYSIARLRAEATQDHYEGIGAATPGRDGGNPYYDASRYARNGLDTSDPAVSWPKSQSITEQLPDSGGRADGLWIDFNGDGQRSDDETKFGSDKRGDAFQRSVTGFHAGGINMNTVRTGKVSHVEDGGYGPSGTHSELGDYFRVRAVDAASLLNINNFRTEDNLRDALLILGEAIDAWINGGEPSSDGRDNPFPPQLVEIFVEIAEQHLFIFQSKEQLRPIWAGWEDGDRLYDLAMNFITVNSWTDPSYRDFAEANMANEEDNPLNLPDVRLFREGYTGQTNPGQEGQDGWPEWQPQFASGSAYAPVNINTATVPVLVTLLANIQANGRLMYFSKEHEITYRDVFYGDKTGGAADVRKMASGTTDLGRQNNRFAQDAEGVREEGRWAPPNPTSEHPSRSIFQLVPIGPINTVLGKDGSGEAQQGSEDQAWALAQEIVRLRNEHPFTSWQDFDNRFCRQTLLQLNDENRDEMQVPDVVGEGRNDFNRNVAVDGIYPRNLLPDPANANHPANPLTTSDAAMTGTDFQWWYWKSCVDMIRAALCPSNIITRYNADYPYHMNVDRMDLTRTNGPICFSSMGMYEVVSQGEIMADNSSGASRVTSTPDERLPLARRKVRSVVQIYEVWRHSSQRDFNTPLSSDLITEAGVTSADDRAETYVAHTHYNTKSGPFSVNEDSNGSWEQGRSQYAAEVDDSRQITYGMQEDGEDVVEDKIKGHNPYTSASSEFGWITMNPQDKTPFRETNLSSYPLTFHARFNESLWARTESQQSPDINIKGVNSGGNKVVDERFGHRPLTHDVPFADFVSSATPRSAEPPLLTGGSGQNEFSNAATGVHATRYSSLQPDGVYLWGGHLRPADHTDEGFRQYGLRGMDRRPRLKILRYPCGSQSKENPFEPIRGEDWALDDDKADGVPDDENPHNRPPQTIDEEATRFRLGVHYNQPSERMRGFDDHNQAAQAIRGLRSNMPYYRGTVDFWIKWDLPPMGSDTRSSVVSLGEIDPASHNFSGLFGATAYGRFFESENYYQPDESNRARNHEADFEGVQFFVYKEPGGLLRFTRIYFTEAFGAQVDGSLGSRPTTRARQFGNTHREVHDKGDDPRPFGGYTGTNDAKVSDDDHGFIYSRTDAWVDLNEAQLADSIPGGLVLRPHDWHRFTLSYNSHDANRPYTLWIDGRRIVVEFHPDHANPETGETEGFLNNGAHYPKPNAPVPETTDTHEKFTILRSSTKILEVNPEDRLTVGCIFRRQVDLTDPDFYNRFYNVEANPEQGETRKPPRPVFRFDSNLVAVANATIDDFRITNVEAENKDISAVEFSAASRYPQANFGEGVYFEHGFFPLRLSNQGEAIHALPVRLATISWTELRPDWDPYAVRGINLNESAGIRMEWAVFESYATRQTGGAAGELDDGSSEYGFVERNTGATVGAEDYWALGGDSLRGATLPSGERVGMFIYRAHFEPSPTVEVNNVTPYLLDVTVTVLTPPRKTSFVIEY